MEDRVDAGGPPGVEAGRSEDVGDVEGRVVALVSHPSELLARTWDNALLFHKSSYMSAKLSIIVVISLINPS